MMKDAQKIAIQIISNKLPDVLMIYQFGSFGTEYQKPSSDLDLAVYSSCVIDKVFLWELAQEIAAEIDRDVDLIDLFDASTVLRYQIIGDGQLIYCSNKSECAKLETMFMSRYLRFNDARASIINDIEARGSIR